MALVRQEVAETQAAKEEQAATAAAYEEHEAAAVEAAETDEDAEADAAEKAAEAAVAAAKAAKAKAAAAKAAAAKDAAAKAAAEKEEALPFDANEDQLKEDAKAADAAKAEAKAEAQAKAALEGKTPRTGTEVATSSGDRPLVRSQAPKSKVIDDLAQDGFEGLELGFGSFPIIKLENEGYFNDTDDHKIGAWFTAIVMNTRLKYVVKNTKCEKKDEEAVYSYDLETEANTGEPISDLLAAWKDEGWGHETKSYLEVTAQLEETDEDGDARQGEMVLISIPPTSRNRISGHFTQTAFKTQRKPNQYVTRFTVGDKVTKADNPFYPWHFSHERNLD